jgi:hypothetical protein
METWNREELYKEIWEQPLVKIATKYGISAVALGKVCRKLQIPLPGRGYWVKKEFGKPVERLPLLPGKDLPVVQRFKFPPAEGAVAPDSKGPEETPSDPEYLQIVEFESRNIKIDPDAKLHPLVKAAERILSQTEPDERGILQPPFYREQCLDLHVSKKFLKRTLVFVNAVILTIEGQGFSVTVKPGKHETSARIFGHDVPFAMVERARVVARREVKESAHWTRTVVDYQPTGVLEFRVDGYDFGQVFRDSKKGQLESLLSKCVSALLLKGRARVLSAKLEAVRELERAAKEREREELARRIAEEEKKVKQFEDWVRNWKRAQEMRDFIAALEKSWLQEGHDLSPEAQKGQRIIWMKQQADRIDPMLQGPPSILDRKRELSGW